MPYTDITLLSQLIAGQADPANAEAANLLAAAQRQVKKFLGTYLAVAHEDDGKLKHQAVLDALANTEFSANIPAGSIDEVMFADGVVSNRVLAINSVTSDKIKDGTIVAADLADGAVTTPKLADGAVTEAKVANSGISADKLSGDGGTNTFASRLSDGSVAAAKMKLATTPEDAMLLMIGDTTGHSAPARVGGKLVATVDRSGDPSIIKFAGSGTGQIATFIGNSAVNATPTKIVVTRIFGIDAFATVSAGVVTIVNAGYYLVVFSAKFVSTMATLYIADATGVSNIAGMSTVVINTAPSCPIGFAVINASAAQQIALWAGCSGAPDGTVTCGNFALIAL